MKYPLNRQYKNLTSPTSLVMVYINETFIYSFSQTTIYLSIRPMYEGWNFNSVNYLFTTDTK